MSDTGKSLGKTIAQLRKRNGLTQGDLAARLDIHASMVTRWERGQVQPRATTLERLAEALGTSVEEIMAGDYGQVGVTLQTVGDPDFVNLFGQLHKLREGDRLALKAVIEAMLTRARVEEAIGR